MTRAASAVIVMGLLLAASAAPAASAPTASQICQKMIADGRGGGLSQADCLCMHRVADAVLDADVKALLFDSWYNGTDNMQAAEALPGRGRFIRQMRSLQLSLSANCP